MNTLTKVISRGVILKTHGVAGKPTVSPVYTANRKERTLLAKDLRKGRVDWRDIARAQALVETGYSFA